MIFFLDTEFIEDGKTIDLISIGLVSGNGQELYLQNADCDVRKANDFVRHNVLPKLSDCPQGFLPSMHRTGTCRAPGCSWLNRKVIKNRLLAWVGLLSKPDGFAWETPEFWADYASYDWVALCQLFGQMVDLPAGWPMYCNDIQTWANILGIDHKLLPSGSKTDPLDMLAHNALRDAYEVRARYHFLQRARSGDFTPGSEDDPYAGRKEPRTVDQSPQDVRGAQEEVRKHPGRKDKVG